jgi:vesicle transport protein SEC22
MVKLTMIARVTDGLPLSEGLDDSRDLKDADFYKQQAKLLFKNLSRGQHEASRMSIETGPYLFQYPKTFFSFAKFFVPQLIISKYVM